MDVDRDLRRPEDVILTPLRSIRKHCLECCGGSNDIVERCTAPKCWLFPYRLGKHPKLKGRVHSEAQKKASADQADRLRAMRSSPKEAPESTISPDSTEESGE